jgi:hypothetical protein
VKLNKLVLFEIVFLAAVLIAVMTAFILIPSLQPSNQDTLIEVYSARTFPKYNVTLARDTLAIVPFEYSSYEPAIILLEVSFQTCDEPGYMNLYCNYRKVASIYVSAETPPLAFNMISVSGSDWVEKPSVMYGQNELLFESTSQNGYAGNLTYQITLRGSR